MPRDIPVGNGSLLVCFDSDYQIRDLYFPHVGQENHSIGHPFRFAVWVDGRFSLVKDWEKHLDYEERTLVTQVRARSAELGLELICHDAVDFELNVYLRQVNVRNLTDRPRDIRVFFHHDFHISGNEVGDTAFYDPRTRSVIHYKGPRYFLANCCDPHKCGVEFFACGTKEAEGKEGTWRDAEDGDLSGNPIAQGSVDSTVGVRVPLAPGAEGTLHYWLAAGTSYPEVVKLNRVTWEKTPQELIRRTRNYWRLWVGKEQRDFSGVPEKLVRLYERSLLILRTQIDANGAIIAANDSDIAAFGRDTYSYLWPRDGAFVAYALARAGYPGLCRSFFDFCAQLLTADGYFLHKYNPDGSVGSSWHPWLQDGQFQLPIQEDETALVLWALWEYFTRHREIEAIRPLYRPLVIAAADFLASFVDEQTELPKPSYDVWEERYGVHTFTVASVIAGLRAAANFAEAFGEPDQAARYRSVGLAMKKALVRYFYDPEKKCFARCGTRMDEGYQVDPVLDSSLYGLVLLGVFAPDEPEAANTLEKLREKLWVKTAIGGLARYERDPYHRRSEDYDRIPGNPWFLSTLWAAQYDIRRAATRADLEKARELLEWVAGKANSSGVLAEQVDPESGAPLLVSPLTWSHAAYVAVVEDYLDKLRVLK